MRNVNYYSPSCILFGWGRVTEVGDIVANFCKSCLMVTVPPFPTLDPIFEKIKKLCLDAGIEVFHFDGVQPNPTTDNVDAGVRMGEKNKVDVVLGVGGGSSIDTAKCISVGLTHEGDAWDYRVIDGNLLKINIFQSSQYLLLREQVQKSLLLLL